MSSLFPRKLDIFPILLDRLNSNRPNLARELLPESQEFLVRVYDAIEAIEVHAGFAAISGGDTLVDGTNIPAGPGRTICLLEADYQVTALNDGKSGIIIPGSTLFADSALAKARPRLAPASALPAFTAQLAANPALPISLRSQSPISLQATRQAYLGPIQVGLFPAGDSTFYLSLCLSQLTAPFVAGERIHLSFLFYGGTY